MWLAFPMSVIYVCREREREAADVGERSEKGTCAWGVGGGGGGGVERGKVGRR